SVDFCRRTLARHSPRPSLGSVSRACNPLWSKATRSHTALLLWSQSRPDYGSSGIIECSEFLLMSLTARLHLEDTPIDRLLQCFDGKEKPSGMQRRKLQVAVEIEGNFQQRLVLSARRYPAHNILAGSLLEPRRQAMH